MNNGCGPIAVFLKRAVSAFLAVNLLVLGSPVPSFAGDMQMPSMDPAMASNPPAKAPENPTDQAASAMPSPEVSPKMPTSDQAMMMGNSPLSSPEQSVNSGSADLLIPTPQGSESPASPNPEDNTQTTSENMAAANQVQSPETAPRDIDSDVNAGIEAAIAALEATKAGLLKSLEEIQKQIEAQDTNINKLTAQIQSLEEKMSALTEAIRENDRAIDKLSALNVKGSNYCRRNPCTQEQLNQLAAWRQQIAAMRATNEGLKAERASIRQQIREKESALEEARRVKNNLLQLKSFVEFSIQMIDAMIEQLRKLLGRGKRPNPNPSYEPPVLVAESPSPEPTPSMNP